MSRQTRPHDQTHVNQGLSYSNLEETRSPSARTDRVKLGKKHDLFWQKALLLHQPRRLITARHKALMGEGVSILNQPGCKCSTHRWTGAGTNGTADKKDTCAFNSCRNIPSPCFHWPRQSIERVCVTVDRSVHRPIHTYGCLARGAGCEVVRKTNCDSRTKLTHLSLHNNVKILTSYRRRWCEDAHAIIRGFLSVGDRRI